jgi:hemerythrin-like domain-containing protein
VETTLTPADVLKHEHEIAALVLDAAAREVCSLGALGPLRTDRIGNILRFVHEFVERCHEVKEENFLFPMLRACSPREGGDLVEALLEDHERGRRLSRVAGGSFEAAARGDVGALVLAAGLDACARFFRVHMAREDAALWPLVDRSLSPRDQKSLLVAFDKVEAQEMGLGAHDRLHQLAQDLAKE